MPLRQAVGGLCLGPSATSSLPPTLCPPSSQGFESLVGEACGVAWPILPSAQVTLRGGPLLPTEGLRGDPRLLLCLRSHQGLLGNVTCILTQLKTTLAGGTVPWERLWAEGLYWYHILTVVTSDAGYLQTALSQPLLQVCTPQPQKGKFTQDHSSQGMPGADLQPPPSRHHPVFQF